MLLHIYICFAKTIYSMRIMFPILQIFFFVLATILVATSQGSDLHIPHQIHLLRPKSGIRNNEVLGLSCQSWRLGVETNNIRGWATIPKECERYVGHYLLGEQHRKDSAMVCKEALVYVKSQNLTRNGKDIWVFDIDETSLSNLPYFAEHGFGVKPYNPTSWNQWVDQGKAPAMPETLKLYKRLLFLGLKIVFLTGRPERQRLVTATNLKKAGFSTWTNLILKASTYPSGTTAVVYKSNERRKLVNQGYKIIGNMGDQWSDLLGNYTGGRTFKLPDPIYYIS